MPSLPHQDYRGVVPSGLPHIEGVSDLTEIGRGGFGVVYRGIESEFGREVAVKVLLPSLDERARKRFERERRAMGAVSNHPNIVTVYRGGVAPTGQPYLVMEYLPGGSLANRLKTLGPVDWRAAAAIGAKLADALAVAHRAGILHRDLKPGNVFQTEAGEPKLGDFGIARLDDGQDSRTGSITASIAHAPPEIVDGERGDERSDLYSLASTIYALTKGAAPFSRESDTGLASLLSRIAHDEPPQLQLETAADEFEAALMQALSKNPDDRQSTVLEFGNQLSRAALAPITQRIQRTATPLVEPTPTMTVAKSHVPIDPTPLGPPPTEPEPSRSTSSPQLAFLALLALIIAGFGGWAVARAAFGANDEPAQPTTPTAVEQVSTAVPTTAGTRPTPVVVEDPTAVPTPTPLPPATATPTDDPDALPDGFVTISDSTQSISIAIPREWATEINDLGDFPVEGGFIVGLSAGASFLDLSGDPEVRDLSKSGITVFVTRLGSGAIDLDGLLDVAIAPFADCQQGDRSELLHPQGTTRFQILVCPRPDGEASGVVVFILEFRDEPGTVAPIVIQIADDNELDSLDVISFLEVDLAAVPDR